MTTYKVKRFYDLDTLEGFLNDNSDKIRSVSLCGHGNVLVVLYQEYQPSRFTLDLNRNEAAGQTEDNRASRPVLTPAPGDGSGASVVAADPTIPVWTTPPTLYR
jgi:hypothetical protein